MGEQAGGRLATVVNNVYTDDNWQHICTLHSCPGKRFPPQPCLVVRSHTTQKTGDRSPYPSTAIRGITGFYRTFTFDFPVISFYQQITVGPSLPPSPFLPPSSLPHSLTHHLTHTLPCVCGSVSLYVCICLVMLKNGE